MLRDLVRKNRSYRRFDETDRVTRSMLTEWIDIARFSPASVNIQPLKYELVTERSLCEKIFPLTAWAKALPNYAGPPAGHRPTGYILVCCDTDLAPNPDRFARDVGIVAQTILLAATEAGYGGCMIGAFQKDALAASLGLAARYVPCLLLALGKPDEPIVLEEAGDGDPVYYYRDSENVHHVPKRGLDQLILS